MEDLLFNFEFFLIMCGILFVIYNLPMGGDIKEKIITGPTKIEEKIIYKDKIVEVEKEVEIIKEVKEIVYVENEEDTNKIEELKNEILGLNTKLKSNRGVLVDELL